MQWDTFKLLGLLQYTFSVLNFFSFHRKLKNWWRFFMYKSKLDKDVSASANFYVHSLKRWELDYQLEEIDRLHLFDEYIEMSKIFFWVNL